MIFEWDPEKNGKLKMERGISFEEIAFLLGSGCLWAVTKHWNEGKYPEQRIFLIPVDGKIIAAPFLQDREKIFLKTAFPLRKMTKIYKQEQT